MSRKKKPPILSLDQIEEEAWPPVVEIPDNVCLGIGRIIAAHAFLESRVQELLFDLMIMVDYPAGRVAFEYRSAPVLFQTARRLLAMWGIKPTADLQDLE